MIYVVLGSSTTAVRFKKIAERTIGYPVSVVHTPAPLHKGGCSYSVRIDERALNDIKMIADDSLINIKGIYTEKKENGERVYHAVS